MSLVSENIRHLRKRAGWTQQDLADQIDIKRSLVGAYEEGRAEPSTEKLRKFSAVFNISVDDIIGLDLRKDIPGSPPTKILAITVDEDNKENIEFVPQKAAAGYLNGYGDPEFISELPRFNLPFLPSNATFRAFEISGDSMLPIVPGTIIIGEYVESLNEIKDGKTYVLITNREGIVFKRVFNYLEEKGKIFLTSDNKQYASFDLDPAEVLEIWKAKAYISVEFPDPEDPDDMDISQLASMISELKADVKKLRLNT